MITIRYDGAVVDLYICTDGPKALQMLIDRPAANIASAGKRDAGVVVFS